MLTNVVTSTDKAYEILRHAIVTRELPQGRWLRQRAVAAKMGMSPTPLVQAFQRLQHEGLLENVPRWGVRVRALTVHELRQVLGMRLAMETLVYRELASRADELADAINDLRPLAEEVDSADEKLRMDVLEGRQQAGTPLLIDHEFHLALARLTGMDMVVREIDRLCLLPATALALVPKKIPMAVTHVELLDAILTGEPDIAERAVRTSNESTAEYMLPRLREQFGDGPIVLAEKEWDGGGGSNQRPKDPNAQRPKYPKNQIPKKPKNQKTKYPSTQKTKYPNAQITL